MIDILKLVLVEVATSVVKEVVEDARERATDKQKGHDNYDFKRHSKN